VTEIGILATRYVGSYPRRPLGGATVHAELGAALEAEYASDAHMVCYTAPNHRRLSRDAIDRGVYPTMTVVAFDVDCAAVHGTSTPAPLRWRRDVRERVQALAVDHPRPAYYETRGGARIVYRLPEPVTLTSQELARDWSQTYAVATAHLRQRYGIEADPACGDWQRLYRLPRAVREGSAAPESWPVSWLPGDEIGTLRLGVTWEAMRAARKQSRSFRARRELAVGPYRGGGGGLLYHLLRGRGDLVSERDDGSIVIRCPRESDHTSGTTGDGSTLLYPPGAGAEIGAIHCLHGHCSDRTVRDWLSAFGEAELEAARAAAGIRRVAP